MNTLVCTYLVGFENDEFVSKVEKDAKQACELVEAGFESVCTAPDQPMAFRKGK